MSAQELELTVLKNNANLKAYYRFESGALTTDSSGNSRTLTNSNTSETTGVYGGGASFNGTSSKLQLPAPTDLSSLAGITYSVWVNASNKDYGANDGKIIDIRGATHYAILAATTTKFQFIINSGTATTIETNEVIGSWVHLVGTYDGTTMRLYLNGNQVASSAKTGTLTINSTGMIGQEHNNAVGRYFQGSLDEVAIFSTALSADQIKELYEGRFLGEAWPQSGLVAGYHFNGSSTDFSGNNYHGTDTAITYSQANGKFGRGAGFNGTSSQIVLQYLSNTSYPFSLSVWVNWNAVGAGLYVLNRRPPGNNANYGLNTNATSKIAINSYNGSTAGSLDTTITPTTGVWYHIVAIFNGTSSAIYLNGNLSASGGTIQTHTPPVDTYLGANAGVNYTNMAMDELLMYSRVLSAQEIRKMYAWGTGKLQ